MLGRRGNDLRRILLGAVVLLLISSTALLLIARGPKNLVNEIKKIRPLTFILSISMIYLGEMIRGIRLKLLVKASKRSITLRHSILSRLLGRFAATITPGGFGGSPTRASIIGTYSGAEIGEALGISLLETFADTIWPAIFILVMPLIGISSLLMVIISFIVVLLWLSGTLAVSSSRLANRIYRRFKVPESLFCRIERQRTLFVSALKRIGNVKLLASITLLTIVAHMSEALGVLILEGVWNPLSDPLLYLKVLAAVESSYILVSVPTPGGSGGVEYGLYLYLGSSLAVKWRIVQLAASLLPGVLLALLAPRLLYYIKEISFPDVGGCSEGIQNDS